MQRNAVLKIIHLIEIGKIHLYEEINEGKTSEKNRNLYLCFIQKTKRNILCK